MKLKLARGHMLVCPVCVTILDALVHLKIKTALSGKHLHHRWNRKLVNHK